MSKHATPPSIGYAACAIDLQAALAGNAQIFPMGPFRSSDGSGRPAECSAWQMTPEIAQRLAAAASARRTPLSFDYEHQTLRSVDNGKPAPSAGWFRTIELRDEGVWATGIEWTAAARQMIEAKEYLFTSPLFRYDLKSGEVTGLLNVALTNNPAIDGMDAVAACAVAALSLQPEKGSGMDELLEKLRWMLNLPVTATAEDILGELDKLKAMISSDGTAATGFSMIAYIGSLRGDVKAAHEAVAAASAAAGAPDPAKFVPIDQLVAVQNQLAALSQRFEDGDREKLLEAGLSDGRILPAMRDYWSKQPLAALSSYLDVAKPIPALAATQTGGRTPAGSAGIAALTSEQSEVAAKLGLDPEKFATTMQGAK